MRQNQSPDPTRRSVLTSGVAIFIPSGLLSLLTGCEQSDTDTSRHIESDENPHTGESEIPAERLSMKIYYLEIVTPEVDALCAQYTKVHGVHFSEPDANLGGARTAQMDGGGMLGIRAPMRDTETPVMRPYVLVDDIEGSVASAAEAGGEVALPPMAIPGHGTCAVVIHGGVECGLWQI